MSDIDGVNSFWIQARAEWDSERTALQAELDKYKRAWAESELEAARLRESVPAELAEYKQAWADSENDRQRLRAAITQMITYLSGDNFRSQQMAHAKSVGEKALSGRYGV